MHLLNGFSNITTGDILETVSGFGSPVYLYDEQFIASRCRALLAMPNAYGLTVRYAMKANSNRTLLRIIQSQGLLFDASSLNEVRRGYIAGIPYDHMILTSQEVPLGVDMGDLQGMMMQGLKYNVCSLRQLEGIAAFASAHAIALSIRVHPGVGSGESATRNTGDNYSCFGIHLSDIGRALALAKAQGCRFDHVHVHIGSGADPDMWRSNIDLELSLVETYFPDAHTVSFGGGLKEARMPDETAADIALLGDYAKKQIQGFFERTGRKLHMEIEPGTFVVANAGYAVTQVMDKKQTGDQGLRFVIVNGGIEINARPLMYGSRHPFYVIAQNDVLLSSAFNQPTEQDYQAVIVGRCCESGDSQCLNPEGLNIPRGMAEPAIGDFVVIGGVGAYCASMAPMNYNSHLQVPEILLTAEGTLKLIRRGQTLDQLLESEL